MVLGNMDVWLEWTAHIDRWGPLNAYSIINTSVSDTIISNSINANYNYWTTDYPPFAFINLWLAMKAAAVFGVSWMIGIKLMLLVYYLATWVSLIYLSTILRRKSIWTSIAVVSGLYLGGLYFAIISQAFTTLDITFAPYVIFSLALFARRKYLPSGICFALAVLVKWIAIMMLPVFLFYFIIKNGQRYKLPKTESHRYYSLSLHERAKIHSSPRKYVFSRIHPWINSLGHSASEYKIDMPIFKFLVAFTSVFVLLIIVFLVNHLSLFSLAESLRKAFSHGVWYFEIGSLNFVYLIQYGVLIPFYPETYVMVIKNNLHIFSLITGVIFLLVDIAILKSFLIKKKDVGSLLQASLMISWSYFILRTGVHANHLFITILAALCLAIINTNKSNIRLYLILIFFGLSPVLTHGFPVRGGFVAFPENLLHYWLLTLLAAIHVLIYLVYLRKYLAGSE
ncbi:MAG: hypothetical protein AAB512_01985 [Patescibacteria group bacterium]